MLSEKVTEAEIIDLIYGCLLGENGWQDFLVALNASLPDSWTVLFSHDASVKDSLIGLNTGRDASTFNAFHEYYQYLNPWTPNCTARELGQGAAADDYFPNSELVKTEFYNDFLLKNGSRSGAGVTLEQEEDRFFIASTITSTDDPRLNRLMAERYTRIAPHLIRAANYYRRARQRVAAEKTTASVLDAIGVGSMVINPRLQAVSASAAAQSMLPHTDAVRFSPLGKVSLAHAGANAALQRMSRLDYAGPRTCGFSCGGLRLSLVRLELDVMSFCLDGPVVMLVLDARHAASEHGRMDRFCRKHALSRAERRAMQGILDGRSIREIAEDAGVAFETVRSQIKSLYLKTGANSAAAILRLYFTFGEDDTATLPAARDR